MGLDLGQPSQRAYFDRADQTLTASTDIITRFGTVRICWHHETVVNIVIGPFAPGDRRTTVRRFLPASSEGQELIAKFINYFKGKRVEFDVPLPPDVGTGLQRRVWKAIRDVPYGQYETCEDLAARLGLPDSRARHVGNAAGQNPLPIIFPCHRVVASSGSLVGYSAGSDWKKALLELECVSVQHGRVRVQTS